MDHRKAAGWTALIFCVAVAIATRPIAVPLILAAWFAALAAPETPKRFTEAGRT